MEVYNSKANTFDATTVNINPQNKTSEPTKGSEASTVTQGPLLHTLPQSRTIFTSETSSDQNLERRKPQHPNTPTVPFLTGNNEITTEYQQSKSTTVDETTVN
nr:hypothetical protein [Endozoicomonas sp.]